MKYIIICGLVMICFSLFRIEKKLDKLIKKGELTWEKAQRLYIISMKVCSEFDKDITMFSSTQEMFEEILRRYKEAEK